MSFYDHPIDIYDPVTSTIYIVICCDGYCLCEIDGIFDTHIFYIIGLHNHARFCCSIKPQNVFYLNAFV